MVIPMGGGRSVSTRHSEAEAAAGAPTDAAAGKKAERVAIEAAPGSPPRARPMMWRGGHHTTLFMGFSLVTDIRVSISRYAYVPVFCMMYFCIFSLTKKCG